MIEYFRVKTTDELPLDEELIMVFSNTNRAGVPQYDHHIGECILVNGGQSRMVIAGNRLGFELGVAIDEYLHKRLVKYGRLLPSENLQPEEVFGETYYIITLESEDNCQ